MTSVVEVLREARSLVDTPEKWCQGAERVGNALCSVGAISVASGMGEVRLDFFPRALETFRAVVGWNQSASWWNDAPERTHADVLAAFDKAIALAEAEEA